MATSFDNSPLMTGNPDKDNITALGITLAGEFGGVKDVNTRRELMKMAAASAVNTYGKGEWIGNADDFKAHLDQRFYAPRDGVSGHNQEAARALAGQTEENTAKDALQIASAARRGTLEDKYGAQYYMNAEEIARMKREKSFDFSQVDSKGKLGPYELFAYKPEVWAEKQKTYADKAELQRKLKELGLYDGKTDGSIGPKSKEAIKAFQRASGLKADGIAGKQTKDMLAKLFEELEP